MGSKFSGLGRALYDSKRREFLGRDGGRWAKLGVFYFFFYLGLAGFFCAMLAVFMALTPRDRPYYYSHDSRMETRSYSLSPGLGFRPQPVVDKNLIIVENGQGSQKNLYTRSLDQYLNTYYPQPQAKTNSSKNKNARIAEVKGFTIPKPGDCVNDKQYGYGLGRPCVLVKLNKIVDFMPEPFPSGDESDMAKEIPKGCPRDTKSIPVTCTGEFPADVDNIGQINYFSKDLHNATCGLLPRDRFPYLGKQDRQDVYQAPYVWAQFVSPKKNVLINVICRAHAQNIEIDKKTGRGVTRFQIFVVDNKNQRRQGDL